MWKIALVLILSAKTAMAGYGAVAYDATTRQTGYAWDQDTKEAAAEAALKECGSEHCTVRFTIPPERCGAFATPNEGAAWGGAFRTTLSEARFAAALNCRRKAKHDCTVRGYWCNSPN